MIIDVMLSGAAMIAKIALGINAISAQTMIAKEIKKQQKEGRSEMREATKYFREIMNVPEKGIPRELLENAEAVGVFSNVVKAGFIVGGRGGNRVVARRMTNGWSAPVFYNIDGSVLTADNSINEALYKMKASEILDKPESVSLTNVSLDLRGFSDIVKFYVK